MSLLVGQSVLALEEAADSALSRFLVSLGAEVARVTLQDLDSQLSHAHILIERRGIAYERERHSTLIHCSVTPFGRGGPRGHWRGSELVASAMGGTLRLTGEPDRPPVKEALDACWFHADMAAAAGVMAAHYERGTSGLGQHVDVSVQEVAFSRNVNSILVWQFDRRKLHRVGGALNYGRATVRCIWPLADGFCFHSLMTGRFGAPANQALSDWIDETGLPNPLRGTNWLQYNRSTLAPETRTQWEAAIEAFFRTRTRAEIAEEGRRRGINATVIAEPADVLRDPHLEARAFWRVDSGVRTPSRFGAVDGEIVRSSHSAVSGAHATHTHPAAASHASAKATTSGTHAAPIPTAASASHASANATASGPHAAAIRTSFGGGKTSARTARPGPLAGVRVLDFSWALVGSITTKVLGDFGCEVVKVESRGRPCLSRIDVQVSASRADSFDDKPWFAHLNSSKRSLALDMKNPASREVLEPLIEWADVVVENFSPGTMAKLGLDYEQLKARNPNIVMVSGSVYGQTGPLAEQWGVDGTGAALSGRTYLTGWPDRAPVIPGAVPYGDVIVPYVMAATVAAALQRRRETGRGCHIDAAMYEICVQQMQAAILAAQQGTPPQRSGNNDPAIFHQGLYPARGEDRWVAITLHTRADWERLSAKFAHHAPHSNANSAPRELGLTAVGASRDFFPAVHDALQSREPDARDVVAQAAAHERAGIDTLLTAWTSQLTDREAVEILQGIGIAAGVVQDIEDMMERDPQLAGRGALMELEHPLLGVFGHVRTPVSFSRSVVQPFRAPSIGEHSHEIAEEIGGLAKERIAELEAGGVFR